METWVIIIPSKERCRRGSGDLSVQAVMVGISRNTVGVSLEPGLAVFRRLVEIDVVSNLDAFRRLTIDRLDRLSERKLAKTLAGNVDNRLDDAEEYLTGASLVSSGFVQAFEVLAELSNNSSEIRKYFRQAEFGQVEIKCRHIPIEAETIRRRLPLPGKESAVLIFARVAGKARALVCRRVSH